MKGSAGGYLEVRELVVEYPKRGGAPLKVVDHVDLIAEPKEIVALVGPSGCGKSTLIHAIAGFVTPTSGSVRLDGEVVVEPSPSRGVVLQDLGLFAWKTVRENVRFGLESQDLNSSKRKGIVDDLLGRVKLAAFESFYPSQLSGGMAQRVALARALAPKPRVLLLDEPFGSLDAQTRFEMQSLLLEMQAQEGVTVIVVTHDVEEAVFLADRIILLSARPARVLRQFRPNIARPRSYVTLTDSALVSAKGEILSALRDEILHANAQAYAEASLPKSSTLRVGMVPTADALPVVAAARLLQEKKGAAAAEIFKHDSGPALVRALASGDLDIALVGACPFLVALHSGLPLAVLRDGGHLVRERHQAGLVVRSTVAGAEDEALLEYPVGLNGFGTNSEFLCRKSFGTLGVRLHFRVMPTSQIVSDLQSGHLEVAVLFTPQVERALAIPGIKLRSNFLELLSPIQSSLLVTSRERKEVSANARAFLEHWDSMVRLLTTGSIDDGVLVDACGELGLKREDSLPLWDSEVSLERLILLDTAISSPEMQWQPIEFSKVPLASREWE